MKIANNLVELIGHTPLLRLSAMAKAEGADIELIGKMENLNPGGSVKDRPALFMIRDAVSKGLLKPGGTIIEPTSGNMGIGLSWIAAAMGYKMIVVMPDSMSRERCIIVRAYGARLELSPGAEGMSGALHKADELHREIPGSVILGQFDNEMNPEAHAETTAKEIWQDTDGQLDVFVAGIGTGGTLSGTGKALKRYNPAIRIVGVEPAASPMITQGRSGAHKLQGLGANFIPKTYHSEYVDEVIPVGDDEAILTARRLAATEGLLVGISAGAAVCGALHLASRPDYKGKRIIALLPDTGERYLSTYEFDFDNYPL